MIRHHGRDMRHAIPTPADLLTPTTSHASILPMVATPERDRCAWCDDAALVRIVDETGWVDPACLSHAARYGARVLGPNVTP